MPALQDVLWSLQQPGDIAGRFNDLAIAYPAPNTAKVGITLQHAVLDKNGKVHIPETIARLEHEFEPLDFATLALPLFNPQTGQAIPGQTMPLSTLMVGIYSAARYIVAQQIAAQQPPVQPE